METIEPYAAITILDVLGVDLCARAILVHVPVRELVRSERVCRRWQTAVLNYLRRYHHTNVLYYVFNFYFKSYREGCNHNNIISRQLNIYFAHRSLLSASKSLEKFGPPERTVSDEYFKNIASGCPYLSHLKTASLNEQCCDSKELRISELVNHDRKSAFSNGKPHLDLTGDMSKLIKSNDLTLKVLRSTIYSLQNITTLVLDDHNIIKRDFVHLLLNAMPQLVNLSFCNYTSKYTSILYNDTYTVSDEQLIESISELTYLKRLHLRNNTLVNDYLLEKLVRCKELSNLDVSYSKMNGNWPKGYSAYGVAALCRRSPSAITTICLGYIQLFTSPSLDTYVRALPVVRELEKLGCRVELTTQGLDQSSLASPIQMQPLELRVRSSSWLHPYQLGQTDELNDLKIVLSRGMHIEQDFDDFSL